MPPETIFDISQLDFNRVVADLEQIRRINPQRYEMEQLTAIVHIDPSQHLLVGYKDVRSDEFWVRGHMPDYPLMPGVIICEAAAQVCSFYIRTQKILQSDFVGFAGLENVRFRGPVKPGDRLVLVAKALRLNRRAVVCTCQGFVGSTMVFHGDIHGVPLSRGLSGPAEQES